MFIRRLCIFILYSLLLCCHAIAQETTYHSKESESVFQGLIELGKRGTPAFSHHGFWHISSLGNARKIGVTFIWWFTYEDIITTKNNIDLLNLKR